MNSCRRRAPNKEIFGWAMFDFANQAYTLLIITVIFGDLFTRVIVGDRGDDYRLGNLLWSLSLAGGYLLVVLTAPVVGAMMDLLGRRKPFLLASYLLTVVATALLYFVAPGYLWLGVGLIVISNYAYSMGEVMIAGFLPDLGPPEDYGRISGFGWALGYVGGLIATAFALLVLGEVSHDNFATVRWVGPYAGAFFLVAALPTFFWLQDRSRHRPVRPGLVHCLRGGLARVRGTLARIALLRDLALFLLSTLCAMAGIYIVVAFTFIYGAQVVGWDEKFRVLTFVLVQLTAIAGALVFGWLQDRVGGKSTYQLTLLIWIAAILLIWQTPALAAWLAEGSARPWEMQHLFLPVALVAGLCLGATQSATRVMVGLFSPPGRAAEFYGFWGLVYKLAAIIGLVGVGLLQALVGLQAAILLCALFFALALLAALGVDVTRGRRAAADYDL